MALMLLIGAGLMIRSFDRLIQVYPGFEPDNVIAAQIYLPQTKYGERHEVATFFERVVERLKTVPGVRSASAASALPMHPVGTDFALPFTVEGACHRPTAKSRNPTCASPRRATSRR